MSIPAVKTQAVMTGGVNVTFPLERKCSMWKGHLEMNFTQDMISFNPGICGVAPGWEFLTSETCMPTIKSYTFT